MKRLWIMMIIGGALLLVGCSSISEDSRLNHYQYFKSALNFEETVKNFRSLLKDQPTIANMTRTGGCFEWESKSTSVWQFICGHNPRFVGPSNPRNPMFSLHKRVVVEKTPKGEVIIGMTPAPNLLFGEYTPSNREILGVAEIKAEFIGYK